MEENYISLEEPNINWYTEDVKVTLKNGHIVLDCYGIYPDYGTVCAVIPEKDWHELIMESEYCTELSLLWNRYYNSGEEGMMDFVIPIKNLDEDSRKAIKEIVG